MTDLWQRSATWIAAAVRTGELTAAEVASCFLARIRDRDAELHAFLGVRPDAVMQAAEAVDADRRAGRELGPLAGVPIAWKDNIVRRGEQTTAGSRLLEPYVSPYTSTVLELLERAGAVPLGRTNLDEFGMGSTTENSAFGPTANPWDASLVPGGSSGGSAAAVAADLCPIALGSDTGGSVRQPAAFCGITGLKPTYGRVSRYGLISYASSLDCVGACARTAEDLALWLTVVQGLDERDPTSIASPPGPIPEPRRDLTGLRIGLPGELVGHGVDAAIVASLQQAADELRALGAEILECSLPMVEHAVPIYYLVATAEASSNLARYDGVRFGRRRSGAGRVEAMMTATRTSGFGDEVQLRILLGTFALRDGYQDEFYGRASRARDLLRRDFARAFEEVDLLLSPTSPVPPFARGSRIDDPLAMYLCDALTVPASLAGIPALSLPCAPHESGLPIGMQLMAPEHGDDLLLATAACYQRATDHHLRRPLP
ncbi:MAG: Asp-tRNA(Asn)/Glu-tRNA(Gln) amidotransferase subunit GatA [Planctomycetes bacterium]|nr:Asp-tRNA(Asn)/Glu-tRNA(Gln) amidotransferase subunit GatA [Planctomycetota bacterium]